MIFMRFATRTRALIGTTLVLCGSLKPLVCAGRDAPPLRVALNADFGYFANVPDLRYRRDVYEDLLGDRIDVPEERYGFLTQNFSLDFLLQHQDAYTSGLQVALGFRNARGGGESSPSGSEFSGIRTLYKQSFLGGRLLNSLSYGLLRSDFLRLHARHHEYRIRIDLVPQPEALNPLEAPFFVRLGPELIWADPTGPDRKDRYGLQWALHLLMRYQGQLGEHFPASLGVETLFRRIPNYRIGDTRYGGAGLLTLSPVVELMLLENLWVGLRWDRPLLRPENREEAFSDAELPGLYGSSFRLLLRTATF